MRELIRLIECLLAEHDCVVVPGLGGFVRNETAAYYDEEAELFYPAGKRIGFNARLDFNDGLLAQSYQKEQGIDYEQANAQIRQLVEALLTLLNQGKYLTLGHIGCLHKNKEGAILFQPDRHHSFDPATYGLEAISYPAKQASRVFIQGTNTQGNFGKWLAAVAACLIFMLMIPQLAPEYDAAYQKNEASMLSLCTIPDLSPVQIPETDSQADLESYQPETTQKAIPDEIRITRKQSERQYLIVIASFPNQADAEQYIAAHQLQKSFSGIGIAVSEERCRVFVNAYEDKEEALFFLSEFRESHPKYAKSWVLSL